MSSLKRKGYGTRPAQSTQLRVAGGASDLSIGISVPHSVQTP